MRLVSIPSSKTTDAIVWADNHYGDQYGVLFDSCRWELMFTFKDDKHATEFMLRWS